jgi:KDO2-lipid IV(A) lauroyltransferase
MKSKSGPLAYGIFLLVRAVLAIMQVFPLAWNLRTARWMGRVWPRIMPRHRRRALDHLQASLGDTYAPDELERLADRCLENVAMFAVEAICLPRLINPWTWSKYIQLRNFDEALELILEGRGAILVTGHYGSFELPGHLLAALGFSTVAVMRPLDNVYLNRFIVRSRQTHGMSLLDKKGASNEAERTLQAGKLLAFIGDQDAGRKGIFVQFFGREASTYKSIGLLAMAAERPIIVGYARRLGDAPRYEIGVERVIRPAEWEQADDPLRWITQTYTTAIERIARNNPEQYLWIHRRWKSRPRARSKEADVPEREAVSRV